MAALSPLQTGGEGHDGASKSPNLGQVGAAASAPSAAAAGRGTAAASTALASTEISSPHELTDWVDSVLDQLETRFESMNDQVVQRMKEMSNRIDALESSIEDLITGATAPVGGDK